MRRHLKSNEAKYQSSLFERLVADDNEIVLKNEDSLNSLVESIKRNIVRILNSRIGASQSSPDLGIGDLNDCAMQAIDTKNKIAQTVKECIKNYEPRIGSVEVNFDRRDKGYDSLKFEVVANLAIQNRYDQVKIDLTLLENRYFNAY